MSQDDLPEARGGEQDFDIPEDDRSEAGKLFGPTEFYNIEAEAALLGALMIDNRLVGEVSERLKEEDFWEPAHGRIYMACVRLVANGKTANPITLRPLFLMDTDLKSLGGAGAYLAGLTGSGAAIIGARDFAAQVVELARMRRIYSAMIYSIREMQKTGEIAASIDVLEQEIWKAADRTRPIRILGAGKMIGLVQQRHERIAATATGTIGVNSRTVPELNSMLGGLEPGQGTILAGRPGMGKTTAAVSFSWGCAAAGHPVFFGMAEMGADLMALKVGCDIGYDMGERIEFERVKTGKISRREADALEAAKAQAELLPIRYADVGRIEITRLEAAIARECAHWESQGRRLELVVLDHVGLFAVSGIRAGDDRLRVGAVSKWSIDIAKKYGLHVLALCQLSRKVEDRVSTDRRPQLSDLRDSGDLEQDFDNVCFVHRPEYYLVDEKPKIGSKNYENAIKDWECDMAEWKDKAELIASKSRLGKRQSRRVKFLGDYSAVRSLTHRRPEDEEEENLFMREGG